MPKVDLADPTVPVRNGSDYPPPFDVPVALRRASRIGAAAGLADFGVNVLTIPPGAWSSQRHWHEADDEFLVMLSGELVLVEDGGRTAMRAGDLAVFPKNNGNGHHLINESGADARFVVVGANKGGTTYPDIDLLHVGGEEDYRHADGRPY